MKKTRLRDRRSEGVFDGHFLSVAFEADCRSEHNWIVNIDRILHLIISGSGPEQCKSLFAAVSMHLEFGMVKI
jgi:hypothetical protein